MMDDAPYNYKNVLKMKSGIGRKDEQIFLDWFPSEERAASFMPSVRWFWRVWICWWFDVDIPQLSSAGIHFGYYSFAMVDSLQFLSIGAFSDAAALESVIQEYGGYL